MEILSKVHERSIVSWAREKPNVLVLSADLTGSTEIGEFKAIYPERFLSFGVAEQNMISFAAGLARGGYVPFIHTFAVFIYRQALNQIACSVAYPNLPVKFFGFLPGITTPGGATHQAIEDIAVLRSVPNLAIFEPGDATEVESVLDAALAYQGPVYVRMPRGEIPRLFSADEPFVVSRPRILSEGRTLTLVSSGICTEEAMRATAALRVKGLSIRHVHVSTYKPMDKKALFEALGDPAFGVIAMENHVASGGLATMVAEAMASQGKAFPFLSLNLGDRYAHGASKAYLMRECGIDAMALVEAVQRMVGTSMGIQAQDLERVRIEPVHSMAKAEGL